MRNGKDSCLFGDELVSYLYDELAASERNSFEGHLLNCSSCTAEFAELSMSRLGMYEWHRDEFVPLATPRFAIPYATPKPAYAWLDAIRSFILTPARLSFAGGALAFLVLALGAFYTTNTDSEGVAEIQISQPAIERVENPKVAEGLETIDEVVGVKALADKSFDKRAETAKKSSERKPVVQARSVKRSTERQLTAAGNRPVTVPRLGAFEEVEDTSLRLADLVADIDSYRK